MALGSAMIASLLLSVSAVRLSGLRVNRALRATHSRRAVDRIIEEGRLSVNGLVATNPDSRLVAGDVVVFDGSIVVWEEEKLGPHQYLKFHKPPSIVCTSDPRVQNNIVDALAGYNASNTRRVYAIGRLDADSTGLILLTSDGDIVNPLLRAREGKRKEYHVDTSPRASNADVASLSAGVVITTTAQREGQAQPVTARTSPCIVERLAQGTEEEAARSGGGASSGNAEAEERQGCTLRFVLEEGRNRQIRRMCATLGLNVTRLHRISFAGVSLRGIEEEGSWAELSEEELLSIGALQPPTREEKRTPEERAARLAKKEAKRQAKAEEARRVEERRDALGASSARARAADQLSCKGVGAAKARRRASRSSLF